MEKKCKLEKLITVRKNNGLSIRDMAKKLDISVAYYCQLELGNRNLYYKLAKQIANIFDTKPDELFFSDISN